MDPRTHRALERCQRDFDQLKAELAKLGFVLPGSVAERRMTCGKPSCRCRDDPEARHGPYIQWTWNTKGHTFSAYLDSEQAALCKEWIQNTRRLQRLIAQMRQLSLKAARLHRIAPK